MPPSVVPMAKDKNSLILGFLSVTAVLSTVYNMAAYFDAVLFMGY